MTLPSSDIPAHVRSDPPKLIGDLSVFVEGVPIGQPRPRAFARKFGNKYSARVYDPGQAEHWKSQIAAELREYRPEHPIERPVSLGLHFRMPRCKGHFGSGRNAGVLKGSAPAHHIGKPDLDNLCKAVMDAMTTLGFWRDDSQIVQLDASKEYGDQPGVHICVRDPEEPASI